MRGWGGDCVGGAGRGGGGEEKRTVHTDQFIDGDRVTGERAFDDGEGCGVVVEEGMVCLPLLISAKRFAESTGGGGAVRR